MILLLSLVAGCLFAGATYFLLRRNIMRLLLGLILLNHGANIVILVMSRLERKLPPFLSPGQIDPSKFIDPLPQALILNAIVINFGLIAFTLALAYRTHLALGCENLDTMLATEQLLDE